MINFFTKVLVNKDKQLAKAGGGTTTIVRDSQKSSDRTVNAVESAALGATIKPQTAISSAPAVRNKLAFLDAPTALGSRLEVAVSETLKPEFEQVDHALSRFLDATEPAGRLRQLKNLQGLGGRSLAPLLREAFAEKGDPTIQDINVYKIRLAAWAGCALHPKEFQHHYRTEYHEGTSSELDAMRAINMEDGMNGHTPVHRLLAVSQAAKWFLFERHSATWDHQAWLHFLKGVRATISETQFSDAEIGQILEAEAADGRQRAAEVSDRINENQVDPTAQAFLNIIANQNQADYKKNQEAARKLKEVLSDGALTLLIELLRNNSCRVRSHAAVALGIIGDSRAIGPLAEFLQASYADESISYYSFPGGGRSSAIEALQELAGREAVPALIEALEDTSWGVREYAAKALCELEDERAAEGLEKLLALPVERASGESGEPRARMWALRALQKIIGDEVLDWCRNRSDTHELVNCECSKCGRILHRWVHGKCSVCTMIHRTAGFTDLHYAIRDEADLDKIRNLCLNGLVNVPDETGFTPLMKASGKEGNLTIVKLLVELGADINAESRQGTSALSMAALHDKQDVVEYLKGHGAKGGFAVRTRSSGGDTVKYY